MGRLLFFSSLFFLLLVKVQISKTCNKDQFQCCNGNCVHISLICDLYDDCPDRSDEPAGCNYYLRDSGIINYHCRMSNGTIYTDNEFAQNSYCDVKTICSHDKCGAFNECQNAEISECYNPTKCHQICRYLENTISCACDEGYYMNEKGSCIISKEQRTLFYYDGVDIHGTSFMDSKHSIWYNNIKHITELYAYRNFFYWIGTSEDTYEHYIMKSLKYSNKKNKIFSAGSNIIDDLAIDYITTNLYFIIDVGQIVVCNNNGISCSIIFHADENPNALSLSPRYGLMFFMTKGPNGFIGKSHMDGTNFSVFWRGIESFGKIFADESSKSVYWSDIKDETIRSISYWGTQERTVFKIENVYFISVTQRNVYWIDYLERKVKFADKRSLNQIPGTETYTEITNDVKCFFIENPLVEKYEMLNPCADSCKGLCLLTPEKNKTLNFTCKYHDLFSRKNPMRDGKIGEEKTTTQFYRTSKPITTEAIMLNQKNSSFQSPSNESILNSNAWYNKPTEGITTIQSDIIIEVTNASISESCKKDASTLLSYTCYLPCLFLGITVILLISIIIGHYIIKKKSSSHSFSYNIELE